MKLSLFHDWAFYLKTGIFGIAVFGACYFYLRWLNIPGELNKSVADTSIILMGLSMVLSSVCYFWNFLDWAISYRKYLGLIGFAFALAHLFLSWKPFLSLFQVSTWEKGTMWPALAGALALAIFTIMALISNTFSARHLGGNTWRGILRTGYIAIILVTVHVVLLKSSRWLTWYQDGMKTAPSLSLIVTIFMVVVVLMRILLWWSLRRSSKTRNKVLSK